MARMIKKLDQQRHELKALRYLLEYHPHSLQDREALPRRDDFQIADCRQLYDALVSSTTQDEATQAIQALELEDTEVESFLRLGGQFYHAYPDLVKERGQEFRAGTVRLIHPAEDEED